MYGAGELPFALNVSAVLDWTQLGRVRSLQRELVIVCLAAAATVITLHILKEVARFVRIYRFLKPLPQAPGGQWLLGHVMPMLTCPRQGKGAWDLMGEWLQEKGPIVRFRVLNSQGVVVGDPVALKRIFQQRFKVYGKDLGMSYHPFLPILGTGLVTSDGDLWQKQRLLIGPALRVEILDDIVGIAKRATDRLSAKLQTVRGTRKAVSIEEEFRLLTLQVIGEAILSLPPEDCDRVFPALYLPVMEESNKRVLLPHRKYLPTPDWFRYKARMSQLNNFLVGLMRERWQARIKGMAPDKGDILDRILGAIEASGARWDSGVETQLCYEIKTFLLAGHETSAAMLMWSLYELTQDPEALAKVCEEAELAYGATEEEPPRRTVDEMTYTLAVLKESLRRYSVVPVVTRNLKEDDELCGYPLPKNSMVVVHLQHVHNLWRDPTVFMPERFLPGGEYDQFDEAIRPYMFVPFIQGPRNCLGQHLSTLEARVVLSLLVKRFRFTPVDQAASNKRHATVIPVASVSGMQMYVD